MPSTSTAGWSLAAVSSSEKQAVNSWVNQHGIIFHQLRERFQKALSDFDPFRPGATGHLPQDCAALQVTIGRAQDLPAIPVPSVQSDWMHAISSLSTGTSDCAKWASSSGFWAKAKEASKAEFYWAKGGAELTLVAADLMRIADRSSL
jgi:hypothetical protein